VRLALTVAGAFVIMELAYLLVGGLEHWMSHAGHDRPGSEQRARTLGQILRNVVEDLARALALCRRVVDDLSSQPGWRSRLLEPVELWGVESLAGSEVQLRLVVRARPGPDAFQVTRELRLRRHKALVEGRIRTGPGREIAITPIPAGSGPAADTQVRQENP
jgi:hypothetical protein